MGVEIKVMYKIKSSNDWTILELTPEQYFAPDLEDEEYEVDSDPRFIDARDYLKAEYDDITNVNILLKDIEKNAEINFYCIFWNDGKNALIERKDKICSEIYHEIIINLATAQNVCEILRLFEENGTVRPVLHLQILNNPDGSQSSLNYLQEKN